MKKLIIFCVSLVTISCEYKDIGLGSNPIDSMISIETREVLQPGSRRLTFYCKTERIYSCANYSIITKTNLGSSAFKIGFTSVEAPFVCLMALGPATTTVDLNTVPNGRYAIEINNANLENRGTLEITDTEINLRFHAEAGIEIVRPDTKRVPPNTYWGIIGYHTESSSTLADSFIEAFADAGAQFGAQMPGHYYYYEIDGNGDIVVDAAQSGYYFAKGFIFQYDGDETVLRNLVEVEGKEHRDKLSIRMKSFQGDRFYNWGAQ